MKKKNHAKKILELGCGQGRDTLFFASKGIDVTALDFSSIAIKGLIKGANEMHFLNNIHASIFDPTNKPIPFSKDEFDAVYSHMFFNMRSPAKAHNAGGKGHIIESKLKFQKSTRRN